VGLGRVAHRLLDRLLERLGPLPAGVELRAQGGQFVEGLAKRHVAREIQTGVIARVQLAQSPSGRLAAVRGRRRVGLDALPESRLKYDQPCDDLLVPHDPVDLQVLAAQQHRYIRGVLAGHRQLMLDLQLHVLRHPVPPQPRAELSRGLALQDLDIRLAHHLAIDVGEHERHGGVLKNRVELADSAAGLLLVGHCHVGFQQGAPVTRVVHAGCVLGARLPPGLLQPELQLTLVRVQAHGRGGIGTADPAPADFQPLPAVERARVDQAQGVLLLHLDLPKRKRPA